MLECFLLSTKFSRLLQTQPCMPSVKGKKNPFNVQISKKAFLYLSSLLVVLLVTQSGEVDARLTRL